MKLPRLQALLLVLVASIAGAAEPASSLLTSAQYGAELDRLITATQQLQAPGKEIPALITQLPPSWEVQAGEGKFEVSAYWLQRDLHDLEDDFDADSQKAIVQHLQSLRADLDAYEKAPSDVAGQRAKLTAILSRPEFSDIHGPNWIDRLKQRALDLLFRMLGHVIRASSIPTVGKVFVYSLIGLAVFLVGLWVYRNILRDAEMERVVPQGDTVSAKEWTVWMAEAREAAQKGNWRDAIHLAYWAGISLLEARGMWRPDRARTPREYLRLLPAASEHRPPLTALTRDFEAVWYGKQDADAQAFAHTLEELERLGCR